VASLLCAQSLSALVITGSDLLEGPLREALEQELVASGLEVDFSLDGSLLGLDALNEGTTDAAILAVPDEGEGAMSDTSFPFAYQLVVFAVHSSNPVSELTYQQLSDLYQNNGVLNDWADLTPDLDWRDRKVALWATRSSSSMALEIFNAVVLKGQALKDSVRYAPNDAEVLESILLEDPSALVAAPSIARSPSIRFLAIKQDDSGQAYTPSEDNVFFGDYPLRLPFYLVASESLEEEELMKLVKAIYSPVVTQALKSASYLPVSSAEQQSLLSRFQ
jgi:ABC-type phosphate transport system substrate-binding protein